jgi:hypothetical protein
VFGGIFAALALGTAISSGDGRFDDEPTRGWHRGGLPLIPHQLRDFELRDPLTSGVGALAFWIRPQVHGDDRLKSYAIVSARWVAANDSYFAISQGWWEPLGRGHFHAIISNRDAGVLRGGSRARVRPMDSRGRELARRERR